MTASLAFASAALAAWLYLLMAAAAFGAQPCAMTGKPGGTRAWPRVTAVVPARNEAEVIAKSLGSLLNQDYPGRFDVILVDDQSTDDTAAIGRAHQRGGAGAAGVVAGRPLPPGWAGKLWAMKQGVDHAAARRAARLSAVHRRRHRISPALRHLVARRSSWPRPDILDGGLRCESPAERGLIPAFVYFFQMLYPFAWVNRPGNETAAAAGGCMLVRRDALGQAGGIEAIRGSLIDDCALGKRMKSVGPIWLGLTDCARSLRPYPRIGDIWQMVSRSAYDQLRYSPVLLAGVAAAMTLIFLAPPFFAVFGTGLVQLIGALAWALMAFRSSRCCDFI